MSITAICCEQSLGNQEGERNDAVDVLTRVAEVTDNVHVAYEPG